MRYLAALFLFFGVAAIAQTPRTATITFTRPTAYTDGSVVSATTALSYKVFQGAKGSTSKALVGTITATNTTISSGLQPGETCWQVVVVANGVDSAPSGEACKTFAFPPTEAVTITVI
jgi:hypothetical protein